MTLYRQLVAFTLALFLVLFIGTWFAKLENTRSFLQDQLESHAQDTASSLGLAITQYADDMVSIETMISALFDRGYYEEIKFIDPEGKPLVERKLNVVIEGVPQWFINMVTLKAPEASAFVTKGWQQAGTIYVKSHPGYAYNTLWEDIRRTTLFFVACGIFVLIAGGFGLRLLLRPLVLVEHQADALCRREYQFQEKIPRTRELRSVVLAMNRMTEKVREMFSEQVSHAEGLRERAYNDPLTGLGNRRYLESQVTARLDRKESETKGILLLVKAHGLEQLNKQRGFVEADEFLKRVAAVIHEVSGKLAGSVAARLSGSDFAVFLPDYPESDTERVAADIANSLAALSAGGITASENVCNVGACFYDKTVTLGRLLAEADSALAAATQEGANTWKVKEITGDSKAPLGQMQWKETLERALRDRVIELHGQPVVKSDDWNKILHLEVFSRIILENGEILSAGVFMPLAERLKLVSSLDRLVIEEVMRLDRKLLGTDEVAVNISPASLQDAGFTQWLHGALKSMPAAAPRLVFELTEFGAVQNEGIVKEFAASIRKAGHKMALDHYGQSCGNLRYLQSLRPDYVKIDRAYTGELKNEDSDSRFFIASICSVAHSIDVVVIAEGVETESQVQVLKELNVDAIQGYVVERPKPLPKS
jgi:diguanylate cyclase (GGDEF)-like protein